MRAVILLFCLVVGIEAKAQIEVVRSFANNLSSWAATNSFTYLEALSRLYNSSGSKGFKTIVSDNIAKGLAVKYNVGQNESYEMDTYINWLQKEIDKGIAITISDIQYVSPDMISEETLQKIVEAGTWAPSGMGRQSAIIVAVTNKELRDRLSRMNAKIMGTDMDPFYGAPVVLIVLADKTVPTHVYDGALVMENLMLAAQDLGIGSCWIHRAKEEFESEEGKEILKSLGIEGDYEGIGHCILGYPAKEPKKAADRKASYIYYAR